MKNKIKIFLTVSPSYFKKGTNYLATKFNCSPRTIKSILNDEAIQASKKTYLNNLRNTTNTNTAITI